ncbi:MAG: hypothetical protein ACI8UO_001170 [Verrucomicrobiales bacterium]|jgi:hypothetical protein
MFVTGSSGNRSPKLWEGTVDQLLEQLKNFDATSSFAAGSRQIFYYLEPQGEHQDLRFHICGAATAKKRWLEWWERVGKDWYSASSSAWE